MRLKQNTVSDKIFLLGTLILYEYKDFNFSSIEAR